MHFNRIRIIGLCLVAVFAFSAVAATAAFAKEAGPKWKVEGVELANGEKREIKFKSGVTKLEVPKTGTIITCKKDKNTGTAASNNIKGNGANPGTDEATILFEECSTSATCKAHNVGTENIEVSVNSELAYETKVAAENHAEPVGIIFRTKSNTVAEFVKIKFTGTGCTVAETTVNATGNAVGTAPGKAGVFCKIKPVVTKEALIHEITCPATAVKAAWNYIGGTLTEHKIGLEAFGFEAKQVGEAEISLTSGEPFSVTL